MNIPGKDPGCSLWVVVHGWRLALIWPVAHLLDLSLVGCGTFNSFLPSWSMRQRFVDISTVPTRLSWGHQRRQWKWIGFVNCKVALQRQDVLVPIPDCPLASPWSPSPSALVGQGLWDHVFRMMWFFSKDSLSPSFFFFFLVELIDKSKVWSCVIITFWFHV